MDDDKWITADARSGRLVIRFRVKGYPKQFFISTGLKDTKRNREIVRIKRDAILNAIALERFDASLESYQFGQKIKPTPPPVTPKEYSLAELWELFSDFKSHQVERTTILGKYERIASVIRRLPTQVLGDAPKIRDYLLANYSHFTAWDSLVNFSRCCLWAVESNLITENPFSKLQIQKPKKKSTHDDFRAFTLDQRDLIIKAFEQHPQHSHYAPLIKFLFWSGCRHGEAFALTWGDISPNCDRITISKSCNGGGIKKGTKNGKRRIFPCQRGSKLNKLLTHIKPHDVPPSQLIFISKGGAPMRTHTLFHIWNKHQTATGVKVGVVQKLAEEQKIPYLNAYSTRHTFATWAIASGFSPDKVAYWIGDDIATVLKFYCHPAVSAVECPDF